MLQIHNNVQTLTEASEMLLAGEWKAGNTNANVTRLLPAPFSHTLSSSAFS